MGPHFAGESMDDTRASAHGHSDRSGHSGPVSRSVNRGGSNDHSTGYPVDYEHGPGFDGASEAVDDNVEESKGESTKQVRLESIDDAIAVINHIEQVLKRRREKSHSDPCIATYLDAMSQTGRGRGRMIVISKSTNPSNLRWTRANPNELDGAIPAGAKSMRIPSGVTSTSVLPFRISRDTSDQIDQIVEYISERVPGDTMFPAIGVTSDQVLSKLSSASATMRRYESDRQDMANSRANDHDLVYNEPFPGPFQDQQFQEQQFQDHQGQFQDQQFQEQQGPYQEPFHGTFTG